MIERAGEKFSGYNKPKRSRTKTKKFAVLAKVGSKIRLIRFGDANMTIKKINQHVGNHLEQGISVLLLKIN